MRSTMYCPESFHLPNHPSSYVAGAIYQIERLLHSSAQWLVVGGEMLLHGRQEHSHMRKVRCAMV